MKIEIGRRNNGSELIGMVGFGAEEVSGHQFRPVFWIIGGCHHSGECFGGKQLAQILSVSTQLSNVLAKVILILFFFYNKVILILILY
jgi:hypothetical protein